jgi:aminopeptidase-like protein
MSDDTPGLKTIPPDIGEQMHGLMAELFPICRSITGDGLRESLKLIQRHIPLELHEVPTGTQVFDWNVPREWNIRDGWVKNPRGEKVIDFKRSSLHVVNYSVPVRKVMPLAELRKHLHTLPDHPDWVPYRTSYYAENWGFCLSQQTLATLEDGDYEVCIDSSLENGHMTYGECFYPGATEDEVLFSSHSCHPSLCNDNLSGMVLNAFLAKHLKGRALRYSYRFLFAPGTIGAISWLALNEQRAGRIKHGLTAACVGDAGHPTYKKTRRGNAEIDQAVLHVLKRSGRQFEVFDFTPYDYDERQYNSPGFNLPVGNLTRTSHDRYVENHTSADNLDFVRPEYLADSLAHYVGVVNVLERNRTYVNLKPKCEPQLGKRGLYGAFGGKKDANRYEVAMFWVLNFSDGQHTLLDIADRSGFDFDVIAQTAATLAEHGLLEERR